MMKTYPKMFIKNPKYLLCQIIRTHNEFEEFTKNKRHCLIEDWLNYQPWQDGRAPYNQTTLIFGIKKNIYEAFSGNTVLCKH